MKKILLIDDDQTIVDGIACMILSVYQEAYEISKAYDGFQALKLLTEGYYHLIISDIKMPYLDGLQLLELICTYQIPSRVVMLSGFDDYSYVRRSLKSGAYDYILKPVNRNLFLELLDGLWDQYTDSDLKLPESCIGGSREAPTAERYFDQPVVHPLPEEHLNEELEQLKNLVFQCQREAVEEKIRYIFQSLSPELLTQNRWKRMMSDFLYRMMEQNSTILKAVARSKLSEFDLSAQIKNQPTSGQLMARLWQILSMYMDELESKERANDERIVRKAQEYIRAHCAEELSLSDIARQFHLHPNYFSALFRKKTGITIRDYILQVRMDRAKELMEDPGNRLIDIALAVGYEDPAHFNRAFKNLNGISPSQYRKQK